MSLDIFWFLPTSGDARYLGKSESGRPATNQYTTVVWLVLPVSADPPVDRGFSGAGGSRIRCWISCFMGMRRGCQDWGVALNRRPPYEGVSEKS